MIASASARLPAPSSSVQPHLAAPAAWDTAAGVAEDQFYAKHDPWSEPKRSSKLWLVVAALVLLIAVATGGYLLLRPDLYASHTVAKASYGAVTTQEAAQPAKPAVAMASKDAVTTGASKSVASMSSGARQAGAPKAGAPSKLVETAPAEVRQAETKEVVGEQTEARQLEAKQAETKLTEAKQAEAKQAEAKQAETKQAETKQAEAKQAEAKQTEAKQAALKPVEIKPMAAIPTTRKLAASKSDVQILAAQTHTDSLATVPAPVISKPAPLETHSATSKAAVSNQPSIAVGAAVSSSLSVTPRSMAASPSSAPTTALASNQPGAITGAAITNRSNAKSASAIANAASATAATSASKPLSAPGNPIASNKPSVAPQPAALKPNETSTIASHGSASEAPLTLASKRNAKTSDAKANETKTSAAKSATDQTSRDATKNLQMAQAMLARDDLSAARLHLSKVLAAQPKNRDAQGLDATLSAREQQRDAVLQTARNCESSGRWICAWHNAGSAIVIDSGSADAKRILSHAMNEAEASKAPPGAPAVESQRTLPDHH